MRRSRAPKARPALMFLSPLWTLTWVKALSVAAILVLLFTAGSDGLSGVTTQTRAENARLAAEARAKHPATPAPRQDWGSAAGQSHLKTGPRNTTVPKSLRGEYPLLSLS